MSKFNHRTADLHVADSHKQYKHRTSYIKTLGSSLTSCSKEFSKQKRPGVPQLPTSDQKGISQFIYHDTSHIAIRLTML